MENSEIITPLNVTTSKGSTFQSDFVALHRYVLFHLPITLFKTNNIIYLLLKLDANRHIASASDIVSSLAVPIQRFNAVAFRGAFAQIVGPTCRANAVCPVQLFVFGKNITGTGEI